MIKVTGINQLIKNLTRFGVNVDLAIERGVMATAMLVRNDAVKSIQKVSQGEQVTRYRAGGASYNHTTSAKGQAPNTDTGKLVASIATEKRSDGVYVGSSVEYAPHLEFGTNKMDARPWLKPALEKNKGELDNLVAKEINRVINGLSR